MEWNYSCRNVKESGYEDIIDILKGYTPEKYNKASAEDKIKLVNEVFDIYRSKNIYPITYYNEEGIKQEILKCVNKKVGLKDNKLTSRYLQGNNLCRFLMPNMSMVQVKNAKENSMYERFHNDHKLKRSIELCMRYEPPKPIGILRCMRLIGGGVATNFYAMKAKALYEKYCPENGIIYDYASGFGGRMLGALSSNKNYRYLGVEPNSETFKNLNILGGHIETTLNKDKLFKIFKMGSEDFNPVNIKEKIDFAFSSPPYFSLEKYSQEETQCYIKFPSLEEWFEGYVTPTIGNIYSMLKHDRYYAVNIADFNIGRTRVEFVDKWIAISEKLGFEYKCKIEMKLQTRRGNGHKNGNDDKKKSEGIFVFYKK